MKFKVLFNGRSFHGGSCEWSLPVRGPDGAWQPGGWHELPDDCVLICVRGFHLTERPAAWWRDGAVAYVAEHAGDSAGGEHKSVHQRVRLLREATAEELVARGIVTEGSYEYGADSVVVASGNARVTASGSTSVKAYGNASVEASGSASVTASGSATVRASGSTSVKAYGNASVEASGRAIVTASGSATVRASGRAIVTQVYGSPAVKLADQAVRIDRRGARVRCYRAKNKET